MDSATSATHVSVATLTADRPPHRHGKPSDPGCEPECTYDAIARARAGDREALGAIYACYAESVFRCAYRILQDAQDAEDATQQVFLKLMSVLSRYERREVPFSAWLMRVARNVALDTERRRRPVTCEEAPDPDPRDDDWYQRRRSLQDALDALPAAQRRVVILRHVVGLSAPEIAECLGKTTGSIHALDQRGRRTLQGNLIELESAPATLEQGSRAALAVAA